MKCNHDHPCEFHLLCCCAFESLWPDGWTSSFWVASLRDQTQSKRLVYFWVEELVTGPMVEIASQDLIELLLCPLHGKKFQILFLAKLCCWSPSL